MEIKKVIGGQEFVLSKASLRMRDQFQSMNKLIVELTDLSSGIQDIVIDFTSGEPVAGSELRDRAKEFRKAISGIEEERDAILERIKSLRWMLLENVLRLNGYEMDRELWYDNADVNDINEIIVEVFK